MFKNAKACEKYEKTTTKEEREADHKARMAAKRELREQRYNRQPAPSYIPANLSRNHPDYGMSMKEHWTEKTLRLSEKSS